MPMYVWTEGCKEDAAIRTVDKVQYEVGVMLLVLGMGGITEQTLPEVLCRLDMYTALNGYSETDQQLCRDKLTAAVGVKINHDTETWSKFAKRMADNFRRRHNLH